MAGREIYQSIVPFVIGLVVALGVSLWPIRKRLSGWKRDVAVATVFMLCLSPFPIGPEGSLVPMGFLFVMFPLLREVWQGPVIIFGITFCVTCGVRMLILGFRKKDAD